MLETADESGYKRKLSTMALGALGVVYGDIGTSPLYALHDGFTGVFHPIPVSADNVLGIVSLIFWALIVVVSLKYVALVMRADNKGEGGIIAIMALALRGKPENSSARRIIMALGIFGAALFYVDGVVTPAISVMSAVEGLEVATPALKEFILPITIVVLTLLFYYEQKGTAAVAKLFGPIMTFWFFTIAVMGIRNIVAYPAIFSALNPAHAIAFLMRDPMVGFFSFGTVVLVLTGVEALYADMGHFGRKPIQVAWFFFVLPSLMLCYFGQGALILHHPEAIKNPFYLMAPNWALYPLVGLSTIATVIASQAVISGAYSMTQQAIQLGYAPRMQIQHTSGEEKGQIYLSGINWMIYAVVIALVVGFKSSAGLAAAFGIAVSGTMLITTILLYIVIRHIWNWSRFKALLLVIPILVIDLIFFAANMAKFGEGGWFPLLFGLILFVLMTTWKYGRQLLHERMKTDAFPLSLFVESNNNTTRVPGTSVFMTLELEHVPNALLHSIKHYKVLHQRVVLVSVNIADVPYVLEEQRVKITGLPNEFWQIFLHYGYMDTVDLPAALMSCAPKGLEFDMMQTTFFLGRETIIPTVNRQMSEWREKLFIAMSRNAEPATYYFKIPANRVVELGSQVTL